MFSCFLDYGAEWMRRTPAPLLIAVSASGSTRRVVQAVERAAEYGALTVALTGVPDSPVGAAAHRNVVVEQPRREPSPGIRSFQASLVGLLLFAIRLAEAQGRSLEGDLLRRELVELADVVDATIRAIRATCDEAAEMIADANAMVMVGSGPSYGTALFAAAKVVEASSVLAIGQDMEEWWHVERFADPVDMPVVVIAPPGRSHWRAAGLAAAARGLGRRVIVVTHRDDVEVARHAHLALPIPGEVREEFSPLVYSVFAGYLASRLAERLGRLPFQGDRPHLRRSLDEYCASLQLDSASLD